MHLYTARNHSALITLSRTSTLLVSPLHWLYFHPRISTLLVTTPQWHLHTVSVLVLIRLRMSSEMLECGSRIDGESACSGLWVETSAGQHMEIPAFFLYLSI